MNNVTLYRLDRISVIEVTGADATAIVNNLTTNQVKELGSGEGRESFVTDVRGKMLGHVCLFRDGTAVRMIGPAGQSEAVETHIDKYTIREDATPAVLDSDFSVFVLSPAASDQLELSLQEGVELRCLEIDLGDTSVRAYGTRWLGDGTVVIVAQSGDADSVSQTLLEKFRAAGCAQVELGDESSFHNERTLAGFPWYGIDLDDSNLPQEADRDDVAISFTKGCYLGQETVARLDALGQVQKKLVQWSIAGGIPVAGTTLECEGKKVARLTSVSASQHEHVRAIGFARRSHFDAGATAHSAEDSAPGPDSGPLTGTVL